MVNSERKSAFVLIFCSKREKSSDVISTLIFAPSTLLTCQVEHQIFNFELRENQREIGVENVVNTKYLVVMNVKIKSRNLSKIWTYILSILHLYSSECPELRWPTSTRKSSWFFTFLWPKNRKANFKSNWPVQPKKTLFSAVTSAWHERS